MGILFQLKYSWPIKLGQVVMFEALSNENSKNSLAN